MNALLKIALRVISRRVEAGEDLEMVLAAYPRLTDEEKEIIREEMQKQ